MRAGFAHPGDGQDTAVVQQAQAGGERLGGNDQVGIEQEHVARLAVCNTEIQRQRAVEARALDVQQGCGGRGGTDDAGELAGIAAAVDDGDGAVALAEHGRVLGQGDGQLRAVTPGDDDGQRFHGRLVHASER